MNIAFAGFRHSHILGLYRKVLECPDAKIVGSFEQDREARESVKQSEGVRFTYESYEELLADDSVEAVAIGDYYQKRGAMVIAALVQGKHVICDKPICTSLDELNEIERLSKEKNLQVCCMLDLRYLPQVQKAKEIIDSGRLGEIKIISFTGQHCLNYGNRPHWYFEKGKHGGTINDIGIHGLDLIRLITGKNLTKVDWARTWNAFADKEPDFRDSAQFSVQMEDVAVTADVSYAAPACKTDLPTYWNFHFWGTKGMMQFHMTNGGKIHIYQSEEEIIDCEEPESDLLEDFLAEVKGKETIMNTVDILKSQRQILQIQNSSI